MRIDLYEDPLQSPRAPADVRVNQVGIFVYEDRRRVAVGFNLTPFRHRPSVQIDITNERGEPAGTVSVIEAIQPRFTLTVHLRDRQPTSEYDAHVRVYYNVDSDGNLQQHAADPFPVSGSQGTAVPPPRETLSRERWVVDEKHVRFDVTKPGEK